MESSWSEASRNPRGNPTKLVNDSPIVANAYLGEDTGRRRAAVDRESKRQHAPWFQGKLRPAASFHNHPITPLGPENVAMNPIFTAPSGRAQG
jgi:hypothetical protein